MENLRTEGGMRGGVDGEHSDCGASLEYGAALATVQSDRQTAPTIGHMQASNEL